MSSKKVFSYTNRQQKTYYIKTALTSKGNTRYYLTQDPKKENIIPEVPEGFEVVEYPFDGKVVLRKIVPVYPHASEAAIIQEAMEKFSPVKDFLITAELDDIVVHISQFSHYFDDLYPSAEEATELYGATIFKWKKYDWILAFKLIDKQKRHWKVVRKANVQYDKVAIDEGSDLKALAKKYCYHVGRASLLKFWTPGEDW